MRAIKRAASLWIAPAALVLVVSAAAITVAGCAKEPDLSTPKAAARAYVQAMDSGDTAAVARTCIASQETVESMTELQAGIKAFREAVAARFGPDEAKRLPDIFRDTWTDALAEIEKADPKIEGDIATFTTGEHKHNAWRLKRVDGKWKVDLSSLDQTSSEPKGLKEMKAMGAGLKEAAPDVKAGKYAKPRDALDAIEKKVRQASPRK